MDQHIANVRKKLVDGMTSVLLDLDERAVRRTAREVAEVVKDAAPHARIVVAGGAGAGKTVFSEALAHELRIPCFDFDAYIPGGHTPNKALYKERLRKGFESLWLDLPHVHSWVVEHVEACNRNFVDSLSPTLAIHLDPGLDHLKSVAQARDIVASNTDGKRAVRASETALRSRAHFRSLPGRVVFKRDGLQMKLLRITEG
jgi:hypothetical protein